MNSLILGTSSTYKIELMERLNIPFTALPSSFEERAIKEESPAKVAARFAEGKARSILALHPDATVIGADQVIALGNKIFSKPVTKEKACEQLRELSGKTHLLFCARSILSGKKSAESIIKFEMEMRQLSDREIEDYVDLDSPLNCCGSYKIESFGIGLFKRLHGPDYTAIIGLPLTEVRTQLERIGYI